MPKTSTKNSKDLKNHNILRLKEIMKEKGISQLELANSLGIKPEHLSMIANGHKFPRRELLLQIAEKLDIDLPDMFVSTKASSQEETLRLIHRLAGEAVSKE